MSSERGPLDFPDAPGDAGAPREPARPAGTPRPPLPPPAAPSGISRYTWFLGVVVVLFLTLITLNTLRSKRVATGGPGVGRHLVAFAVPLAGAPARRDEDANVSRRACRVRGPGVLNICQEYERGPVVLAIFPTDAGQCSAVLGQLERVAPRHPRVRFVAVGSRGDRDRLRRAAAAGGGRVRVGWDRDGAVASLYGLVGCPQVTFARRGGIVAATTRKALDDGQLEARIRSLG